MSDNTNTTTSTNPAVSSVDTPPEANPDENFEALLAMVEDSNPAAAPAEDPPATPPPTEPPGEKKEGEGTDAQPSATEAAPPPTEAAADEPKLPAELRAIAQREQEAFKQQQLAKELMQAASTKEAALKEALHKDPLTVLKDQFGLDYETLSRHAIKDTNLQTTNEIEGVKTQLQQLMELNQKLQEKLEAQEAAREDETYLSKVAGTLDTLKDSEGQPTFPLTATFWERDEAAAQVRNTIQEHYQATGKTIPVAEAAEKLEKMLEGQLARFAGNRKAAQLLGNQTPTTSNPPATPPSGTTATQSLGTPPAGQTTKPLDESDISFEDLVKEVDGPFFPMDE